MGLFSRRRRPEPTAPVVTQRSPLPGAGDDAEDVVDDARPLRAATEPIGEPERERIAAGLAQLHGAGVDTTDLDQLGAALDAAYLEWAGTRRGDHAVVVERFAMGIGAHLEEHTDLEWRMVTDVFGTDLSLTDGSRGSFVVVPTNLVAGRWMRGETGWVPGVVGHLVRRRARR